MGRPPRSLTPTFWQSLRQFPPILVRLSARFVIGGKNVRALSHREIAIASGIPLSRCNAIGEAFSWDDITIAEAEGFCAACNFDPTNAQHRERQRDYTRLCQTKYPTRPPHYLRNSPFWTTEFLPLIQRLKIFSADSMKSPSPEKKCGA